MARSKELAPHVGSLSRSRVFAARGLYKGKKTTSQPAAQQAPETIEKSIGGDKNGGKRLVPTTKASRFYPADDVKQPKKSRKTPKPTKLRGSISPGTLESGLLLVTGPFKVNGVPLRRVNQAYVIATSTKINIADVTVDAKINDAYFAKGTTKSKSSAEEEFFEDGKPKSKEPLSGTKLSDQKTIDTSIIAALKKEQFLAKYLKSSWGLSKGQYPHALTF
ncbi:60S ribosomal protein L6 [Flagelloscypha sp. PMI_526]|nr:60S ribosomal protein L6 [Flagelloscypha sp. PMI_526]